MLQIVDTQWKDHLYSLDHLKEGIGLRGYGQNDPLVEYKKESFALFQDMKARVDEESVRYLFWLKPRHGGRSGAGGAAARARGERADDLQRARSGGRRVLRVGEGRAAGGAARRSRRAPAATTRR